MYVLVYRHGTRVVLQGQPASQFSPLALGVLWFELRSSGLAAALFTQSHPMPLALEAHPLDYVLGSYCKTKDKKDRGKPSRCPRKSHREAQRGEGHFPTGVSQGPGRNLGMHWILSSVCLGSCTGGSGSGLHHCCCSSCPLSRAHQNEAHEGGGGTLDANICNSPSSTHPRG